MINGLFNVSFEKAAASGAAVFAIVMVFKYVYKRCKGQFLETNNELPNGKIKYIC